MTAEKKSQPILLRLAPSLEVRLNSAAARDHASRQDIIREGLVAELDRRDARSSPVSPATAKALADFQSLTGQDPVAVLTRLAREHHAETVPAA